MVIFFFVFSLCGCAGWLPGWELELDRCQLGHLGEGV